MTLPSVLTSSIFCLSAAALLQAEPEAAQAASAVNEHAAVELESVQDVPSKSGPRVKNANAKAESLSKDDWSSIRAAHQAWKHSFQKTQGGYAARNPGQQWSTQVDERGFLSEPTGGGWKWGLELQSYGFGSRLNAGSKRPSVKADHQRLTRVWDAILQEWYVNDPRGLEHGFTLSQRPAGAAGDSPLVLEMAVRGNLSPCVDVDGKAVRFVNETGSAALCYDGLKVWDADGTMLPARMSVVNGRLRLEVEEREAHYPLTVDPIAHQAYLKAGNNGPAADDRFGISVAISGDTVVVGADFEGGNGTGVNPASNDDAWRSGAAYVFVRNGATWTQQAYLKASNTDSDDQFGSDVAVSGDIIVVGAHWEDGGGNGINPANNNNVDKAGAAYVFTRSETTWSQQAYLKASAVSSNDEFGSKVAVSGETIVVGTPYEDGSGTGVNPPKDYLAHLAGAAYVFVRNGSVWSQQAYLKASNTSADDTFGSSVAISNDTIVVGAMGEDGSGTGINPASDEAALNAGAAYIFTRSGTTWTHDAYLKAGNAGALDYFGISCAASGDTIVIGAWLEDGGGNGVNPTYNDNLQGAGAAYLFVKSAGAWNQQGYLKASNTGGSDNFGISVAISGDTVAVGAQREDGSGTGVNASNDNNATDSGAVYIFVRNAGTWTHEAYVKASNTGSNDQFGISVALSGDTLACGAMSEDGSGTGVNPVSNEQAANAGAAYILVRTGNVWGQQANVKASNTGANSGAGDVFGSSVSVYGNTIVVGAPGEPGGGTGVNPTSSENAPGSGAAYVFINNAGVWSQQAYLKSSNAETGDSFGRSVSIHGDTLVVGANNEDGSGTGIDPAFNNNASSAGAVYVFVRSGSTWSQHAYLKASNTGADDSFGSAVAIFGDTVVVGAGGEDGSGIGVGAASDNNAFSAGAAYVFVRNGSTWSQQAYLKTSNTGSSDFFGHSVAVSDDTVVVGAYGEDGAGTGVNPSSDEAANDSGAVYVFERSGAIWSQQAYIKASNTGAADQFGFSVAASGGTIAVGANNEDGSGAGSNPADNNLLSNSGAAYVFVRNESTWAQQAYLKPLNPGSADQFGYSVGLSGSTLGVGSYAEDGSGTGANPTSNNLAPDAGAAYLFSRFGATWTQRAYLKASNTGTNDLYGTSIAVGDSLVVVGATGEDGSGIGVSPLSDNSAPSSGATYIYSVTDPDIVMEEPVGTSLMDATGILGFGSVNLGSGLFKTFTIRNSGTASLNGLGITVDGANAADFSFNTTGMLLSLAPGASTTFMVNFTPSQLGARAATIHISSDDPDENPFDIQLTGDGVSPEISVIGNDINIEDGDGIPASADHTDFGDVAAAGGVVTRIFSVFNTGTATLSLGTLTVTGTHAGDFAASVQPASSIPPGGSTAFEVTFNPTVRGLRSAILSFSNNDGDENPFNFSIQGTGLNLAPTDITLSSSSIAENNPLNAFVGTLGAVDLDTGDVFSFGFVAGAGDTDNGSFGVSGSSLTILSSANFETKSIYQVRLRVSDGLATYEKPFSIMVTDVNEAPVNITLSSSSLAENNAADAVVGTLAASDPDTGQTHAYSLVSGTGSTDNSSFNLAGNSLRISVSANFETKSFYSVRLRATDSFGLSYERSLTLTITNVNEAPTNIALSTSNLVENLGPLAVVGTLTTSDADTGDTRTYSIIVGGGPTDGASFTISGSTLRLTLNADYELQDTYTVLIRVTDSGGLFFEKLFTISVLNKNELPSFTKGPDQTHPIRAMGSQIIPGWATAISDGDSTVAQALSFNSSVTSGGSIFATPPSVSSDGALSYSTNGSAGTAVVSVTLTDDASINANPALTTTAQTFTIRVEGPGSLDSLNADIAGDRVLAMAMQPDGKMLVAGSFTSVLGVPRANIARLNVDGTLDMSFDPKADGAVYAVAVQADGKVLLGGSFGALQPNGSASTTERQHIARVHADGTLDAAFDPKADSHVRSILSQPDGKVIVAGDFTSMQPNGAATATPRAYVARLLSDGSLDLGFTVNTNDVVYALAIQSNQKILLVGDFTTLQGTGAASPTNRRYIGRVNADGTLDGSFDPKANGTVFAVAEQPDGKLLLGGAFTTLQPNGAPSPVTRNYVARVNATGTLDTGFNPSANGSVFSLAQQADGRLLLGGLFTSLQPNGAAMATVRSDLARLNSDGTLDTAFDPNANGVVYGIALQEDGQALIGGEFTALQPNAAPVSSPRHLFARLVNDAASRVLAAPDFTQVTWSHGGAAPVVNEVTFDLSTNGGSSWGQIGVGTRIGATANWQCIGLTLPANGMLRARGRTAGGIYNSSSSLFEHIESFAVGVPDIGLEEPVGTELVNGSGMVNFGPIVFDGSNAQRQFTIRNTGNAPLSVAGATLYGTHAGDFVVNTTGMATSVAPMATTTFTITFTPGAMEPRSASLLLASNDHDEADYSILLAGVGVTSKQGWRQVYFGTTSNSGSAADSADPDNDGLENLLEWACGLSPTANSSLPTPTVLNGTDIEFTYTRSVLAVNAGTVFAVQWSDSLPGTSWSTSGVTQTVLSNNGTVQQVKATLPAGSAGQRFVRLKVTSEP